MDCTRQLFEQCFPPEDNIGVDSVVYEACFTAFHEGTRYGVWQDITTAPTDGSVFLAVEDGLPFICYWHEEPKPCWYGIGTIGYYVMDVNPKFWTPLPFQPREGLN